MWNEAGDIPAAKKAGELWAVALDSDGKYLVGTTYDGRVNVWELVPEINEKSGVEKIKPQKFAEWETRGGYGLAVDVVCTLLRFLLKEVTNHRNSLQTILSQRHHIQQEIYTSSAHQRHGCCIHYLHNHHLSEPLPSHQVAHS